MSKSTSREVINFFSENDSLTRVYFSLLLKENTAYGLYASDLFPLTERYFKKKSDWEEKQGGEKTGKGWWKPLKKKGRPPQEPHNRSVQIYQYSIERLLSKNFLIDKGKRIENRKERHYYKANPKIIKSIVRCYALSKKEAEMNIWSNPSKTPQLQNLRDIIGEDKELKLQRTAKEDWRHYLDFMLKTRRKLKFMSMFSGVEDTYVNMGRYYGALEIPKRYYTGKDRIHKFLMDRFSSRIAAENNIVKLRESNPSIYDRIPSYLYSEILMNLCLYPYINSNKIPWNTKIKNSLQLEFDHDLCKPWNEVIEFIEKERKDHFIVRMLDCEPDNQYIRKLLTNEFKSYVEDQLELLKNGTMPILSEIPFNIQLSGEKSIIRSRLNELHEFLR